jgi:hypothetical protein
MTLNLSILVFCSGAVGVGFGYYLGRMTLCKRLKRDAAALTEQLWTAIRRQEDAWQKHAKVNPDALLLKLKDPFETVEFYTLRRNKETGDTVKISMQRWAVELLFRLYPDFFVGYKSITT